MREQGKHKLRAAGYVRVSSQRQAEEGLSLDEQARRVSAYIEAQDWHHVATFVERGVSGRKAERPELDRLLSRLDDFDVVVVPRLDRAGRNAAHLLALFQRFEDADVRLVSLTESIDTATPVGRLLRSVLSVMAEFEADSIGERVRSTMRARVEKGRHVGTGFVYGYRSEGGHLAVVPEQAAVVRRIFAEYASGKPQNQIQRGLNRDDVPPPKRARRWYQATVRRILDNPIYRGQVQLHGEVYAGEHEAIIEPKLWDEVAQLRRVNTEGDGKGRGRRPNGGHLFVGGALKCGSCGESMKARIDPRVRDRQQYEVYYCYGRATQGPSFCEQEPIPRELIDSAVFRYFAEVGLDVEETRAQIEGAIAGRLAEVRALRQRAEQDDREAALRLARVRRDYQDGKLDADDWREQRKQLSQEDEAAKAKLARLREQEREVAEAKPLRDAEKETLQHLADVRAAIAGQVRDAEGIDAVRAALRRLFDDFSVHRLDRYAGDHPGLYASLLLPGGYVIEPHVRPQVVEGYEADGIVPVLRRIPVVMADSNNPKRRSRLARGSAGRR